MQTDKRRAIFDIAAKRIVEMHRTNTADKRPPGVAIICDLTDEWGRAMATWDYEHPVKPPGYTIWTMLYPLDEWNLRCPKQAIEPTATNPYVIVSGRIPLIGELIPMHGTGKIVANAGEGKTYGSFGTILGIIDGGTRRNPPA